MRVFRKRKYPVIDEIIQFLTDKGLLLDGFQVSMAKRQLADDTTSDAVYNFEFEEMTGNLEGMYLSVSKNLDAMLPVFEKLEKQFNIRVTMKEV